MHWVILKGQRQPLGHHRGKESVDSNVSSQQGQFFPKGSNVQILKIGLILFKYTKCIFGRNICCAWHLNLS
jgi:hypothetical protein